MAVAGKHGITADTPKNILFGPGTIHKGLKYTAGASGGKGSWNFNESIIGATNAVQNLQLLLNFMMWLLMGQMSL